MQAEQRNAEQLQRALSALESGQPYDQVAASLSPELQRLLAAAAELSECRWSSSGGLRPTYVLGLEEQLRTDLRLGRRVPPRRLRRWAVLSLVALILSAGVLVMGVRRAEPGDWLWPARYALGARVWINPSPAAQCEARLEVAYRRLAEVRWRLGQGQYAEAALQGLLKSLEADYAVALQLARQSGDSRLIARTEAEVRLAEAELARLEARAVPPASEWIRDTRGLVRLLLAGASTAEEPSSTPPPVSRGATATTAAPQPTATLALPVASATPVPRTPSVAPPLPTASPTPRPATPKPPPVRPAPSDTPSPSPTAVTPLPYVVTATPTKDRHVVTTTPIPTIVLPGTPVVPGPTGLPTAPDGTETTPAVPPGSPTPGGPSLP